MSEEIDNLPNSVDGKEQNDSKVTDVTNDMETDEALQLIDDQNSKKQESDDLTVVQMKPYESMSMEDLVLEFQKLLKQESIQSIKNHVNKIRNIFREKYNTLIQTKKEEFIEEGGNEIDFQYSIPLRNKFKELQSEYKSKLNRYYKELELTLQDNLKKRLDIIEQIKGLLNVEESINTTYKHFKDLQDQWRNIGAIPRDKYNTAWNTYYHHVERFYDFLHLNRDLRDLDFKHNLEQKQKIVEQAKKLVDYTDINKAFRELQDLHKLWKEELGPVAKEYREQIWQEFKDATKALHNKRQEYYNELDKLYEKNLEVKQGIIEEIKSIASQVKNNHKDWQSKIKIIETLRNNFIEAGKVPIKVNEQTWAKFKEAVRDFNRHKNAFYKNLKKEQLDNLKKKLDLIRIAEDNKDNDDFELVTPLMKKIQSDWKKIGHVPRKDSDKIWNRFKDACNYYFDRLYAERSIENEEELKSFELKNKILESLKEVKLSGNKEKDISVIKTKINEWRSIGRVPQNKRFIENDFNEALNKLFNQVDINKKEAELIKFENKLEQLREEEDVRKINNEFIFIRKKIDETSSEINQLENNLNFFTNVDDSNPLVRDVNKKIEKYKLDLSIWKEKLKLIKNYIK